MALDGLRNTPHASSHTYVQQCLECIRINRPDANNHVTGRKVAP
jgi:hypothetical protein